MTLQQRYRVERFLWVTLGVAVLLLPASIPFDRTITQTLVGWRPPGVEPVTQAVTRLGDGVLTIGLPCVLGLVGWWRGRRALCRRGLLGAATVAGAGLIEILLKNLLCRARPNAAGAGEFFSRFPCIPAEHAVASFPSGHATTAFALAALLALWYPRWAPAFVGLAGLVASSRVVLGAHFPSDVLGGAVLGMAVALTVHAKVPGVRRESRAGADARVSD